MPQMVVNGKIINYAAPTQAVVKKEAIEPIAIAAAGIALGLDEQEYREFAAEVAKMQRIPNLNVHYAYDNMIRIAYEIRERRTTIANG